MLRKQNLLTHGALEARQPAQGFLKHARWPQKVKGQVRSMVE
ncbi:MAG TPA: hypothetical protein PK861_03255 [Thermomonas sp.]|jgi:hypothetical protein|nr:hypothetical protein [Thermomonas sp.]